MKHKISNKIVYFLVFLAWLIYTYFTFTAPISSSSQDLGLSGGVLFLVQLTIVLPYLVVWLMAVYGWSHISSYSQSIGDSKDGKAFGKIANGLGWFLAGLVLSALISSWRSMGINDPIHLFSSTIVTNYVYVFFPLVGFLFLYHGTRHLRELLPENSKLTSSAITFIMTGIAGLSVVLTWLIFTNPNRQVNPAPDIGATYYISDPFIVLTILVPLIVAWVLGGLAVVSIGHYQKQVKAQIYQNFLKKLSLGIIFIVIAAIVLQGILALGTNRFIGIGLGPLLLVIYVFLGAQAAGYVLVAMGAKKLKYLEEVKV
jgi:hypothetical protein